MQGECHGGAAGRAGSVMICGVLTGRTGTPCRRPAVNGGPCVWHDPERKPAPKFWTPARLFKLAGMIELGKSDREIAATLGTTVNGVQLARKRHDIRSRTRMLMNARTVAAGARYPLR